jgi:hypothetical protein
MSPYFGFLLPFMCSTKCKYFYAIDAPQVTILVNDAWNFDELQE